MRLTIMVCLTRSTPATRLRGNSVIRAAVLPSFETAKISSRVGVVTRC